eukprot:1886690-Pleurochrysis_carterae.AAC.1
MCLYVVASRRVQACAYAQSQMRARVCACVHARACMWVREHAIVRARVRAHTRARAHERMRGNSRLRKLRLKAMLQVQQAKCGTRLQTSMGPASEHHLQLRERGRVEGDLVEALTGLVKQRIVEARGHRREDITLTNTHTHALTKRKYMH